MIRKTDIPQALDSGFRQSDKVEISYAIALGRQRPFDADGANSGIQLRVLTMFSDRVNLLTRLRIWAVTARRLLEVFAALALVAGVFVALASAGGPSPAVGYYDETGIKKAATPAELKAGNLTEGRRHDARVNVGAEAAPASSEQTTSGRATKAWIELSETTDQSTVLVAKWNGEAIRLHAAYDEYNPNNGGIDRHTIKFAGLRRDQREMKIATVNRTDPVRYYDFWLTPASGKKFRAMPVATGGWLHWPPSNDPATRLKVFLNVLNGLGFMSNGSLKRVNYYYVHGTDLSTPAHYFGADIDISPYAREWA